jgi:hypothetical protein
LAKLVRMVGDARTRFMSDEFGIQKERILTCFFVSATQLIVRFAKA